MENARNVWAWLEKEFDQCLFGQLGSQQSPKQLSILARSEAQSVRGMLSFRLWPTKRSEMHFLLSLKVMNFTE